MTTSRDIRKPFAVFILCLGAAAFFVPRSVTAQDQGAVTRYILAGGGGGGGGSETAGGDGGAGGEGGGGGSGAAGGAGGVSVVHSDFDGDEGLSDVTGVGAGGDGGSSIEYREYENGDLFQEQSEAGTSGSGSGAGGAGGSWNKPIVIDRVAGDMLLRGGAGGGGADGAGGNGGSVSGVRAGDLAVEGSLSVISGASGAGSNGGAGGEASFSVSAGSLIAPKINLTKNDGELSFNVETLEIGSDTTLTATGLASGDAEIGELLLTGNGSKFTLTGTGAAGVSVGHLAINGGTLNNTNRRDFIDQPAFSFLEDEIRLGVDGVTFNFSGSLDLERNLYDLGGVTKEGTGTLYLNGNNNRYMGNTVLNSGEISLGNNSALGRGMLTMSAETILSFSGNNIELGNRIELNGSGMSWFYLDPSNSATLSDVISGSGGLAKTGSGTLILMGNNNYRGGTAVYEGTLLAGTPDAFVYDSDYKIEKGKLDLNNHSLTMSSLTGAGGEVALGTADLTVRSGDFYGVISGTGSMTKIGNETLTLRGANTYSGNTIHRSGRINIGSDSALGGGTLIMSEGTTLGFSANVAAGNRITISGESTFNTAGFNAALSGVISGISGGSLIKEGEGTLTLSGNNTYTGATTVRAGTLRAGAANAFAGMGRYIVDGGVLDLNGNSLTMSELSGAGGEVDLGSAVLTVRQAGNTAYSGNIYGDAGSLVKDGGGILNLGGESSYGGATTVNAGILRAGAANAFVDMGEYVVNGGVLDLNNHDLRMTSLSSAAGATGGEVALGAADLIVNQSADAAYNGFISGTGSLEKAGEGTLTLTGGNTYAGATTVSSGTLRSGAANAFVTGAYVVNEGVLSLNGYDLTMTSLSNAAGTTGGEVALGAADLIVNQSADTAYNGVISGAGSLEKAGEGALTLTNDNTYTGGTAVSAGTLRIGDNGTTGSVIGNIENHGQVVFNRSDDVAHAGEITGDNGTLALEGAGTVIIEGNVTQKNVEIKNGAFHLAENIYRLTAGDVLSVAPNAMLGVHVDKETPLISAGTVAATGPGAIMNVDGYAGEGQWTVIKADEVIGVENFTMYVAGTELPKPGLNRFMNVDPLINSDGKGLDLKFSLVWKQDKDAHGTFYVNKGNFDLVDDLADNKTSGAGTTYRWDGKSLTKTGAGILTLTGSNAYTGATTVNEGTLRAGSANAFVTGAYVVNEGVLSLNGYDLTMTSLSNAAGATGGEITLDGAALTVNQLRNNTYGGVISGAGFLTKNGTGTLTLTGANAYTGDTTVNEGTLAGNIAENTNLTVVAGAVYDGTGASRFVNALDGAGSVVNSHGLTAQMGDFGGVISGSGFLTKNGTGTLTLTGANAYAGDTTVNEGTLAGNITENTNLTVAAGAVYDGTGASRSVNALNGAGSVRNADNLTVQSGVFDGEIDVRGSLVKNGRGALTLNGRNTYKGDTIVNGGTLAGNIPDNTSLTVAGGAIYDNVNGAVIRVNTLNGAGDIINRGGADGGGIVVNSGSFSGAVSGSGFLTKNGTGTLTLSGANTYTGDTTVNAGTLAGNIGNANLMVARGATYDGTGAARSVKALNGEGSIINTGGLTAQSGNFSGVISGDGFLIKAGAAADVLTLSGANTYTGLTEVRAGTLRLLDGADISDTLSLYGGTTLITGVGGAAVNLSQLDVRGAAEWQGDLNMVGQTMNFYLPATAAANDGMLTVRGRANIADSTVNVDIAGESSPLQSGDTITLINADTLNGTAANKLSDGKGMQGVSLKYEFNLTTEGNTLLATVINPVMDERSKALSEGYLGGGLALANQGVNLIDWKGITEAVSAAWKTDGTPGSGSGIFSALSAGVSGYDTGSRVDMSSFSLMGGLAWGEYYNPARMTFGVFVEYGKGSYDTLNSFTDAVSDDSVSFKGSGDADYVGGGFLGRVDFTKAKRGNSYMEGSFRAGVSHNGYENPNMRDRQGRSAAYDASSVYYGIHIGAGYNWNLSDKMSLDLYGKQFLTRKQGDSISLSTGDPVEFENSDSRRFRSGGRFSYALNETFGSYAGAAYEYEFGGEMRASSNDFDIDAPSLRGGTVVWEGGMTVKPSGDSPLFLDLGVRGYNGKSDGVFGSLRAGIDTGNDVNEFWNDLYLKFRARFEF